MPRPKRQRPSDLKNVHDRRAADASVGLKNYLVPIEVDDPYGLEPGDKITTLRSVRGDHLAWLHSRRQISEAAYEAGKAFQADFEAAERGPQAMDPSKEYVDGGLPPEAITESMRRAVGALNQIHRRLGQNGSSLVVSVLIHGMSIDDICLRRGLTSQRENDYVGKRFRECLDDLAIFYGFATN